MGGRENRPRVSALASCYSGSGRRVMTHELGRNRARGGCPRAAGAEAAQGEPGREHCPTAITLLLRGRRAAGAAPEGDAEPVGKQDASRATTPAGRPYRYTSLQRPKKAQETLPRATRHEVGGRTRLDGGVARPNQGSRLAARGSAPSRILGLGGSTKSHRNRWLVGHTARSPADTTSTFRHPRHIREHFHRFHRREPQGTSTRMPARRCFGVSGYRISNPPTHTPRPSQPCGNPPLEEGVAFRAA